MAKVIGTCLFLLVFLIALVYSVVRASTKLVRMYYKFNEDGVAVRNDRQFSPYSVFHFVLVEIVLVLLGVLGMCVIWGSG